MRCSTTPSAKIVLGKDKKSLDREVYVSDLKVFDVIHSLIEKKVVLCESAIDEGFLSHVSRVSIGWVGLFWVDLDVFLIILCCSSSLPVIIV